MSHSNFLATKCVHNQSNIKDTPRGINSPVYPSTAISYREGTVVYPRYFNTPNQNIIAEKLEHIEQAESGLVFSSGMAAISSSLYALLQSGDHAIFHSQLYGGTLNLLKQDFAKRNIEYSIVDSFTTENIKNAIKPNTRVIYFESPTNPLLQITDIRSITKCAQEHKLLSIIDNTFATPVNQNPIELGADLVIHSGTKYLGGHSDLSFGAVLGSTKIIETIIPTAKIFGGNINAWEAYLIERSLKTLHIRVNRQNHNAQNVAEFLQEHSAVGNVNYPGLKDHPSHEIAAEQMKGFGGMLSFELKKNSKNAAEQFLNNLSIIKPAISLGGVETIISAPVDTSHFSIPEKRRKELGISSGLLRLSIGIEDKRDLISDLNYALG